MSGDVVTVKGPKGTMQKSMPFASISVEHGMIKVSPREENAKSSQVWGLARALIANMVKGVNEGFQKILEMNGVGYKAQVRPASPSQGGGDSIELNLGFTHPITIKATSGISFQVEKNTITVSGSDKEAVGHIAALIRKSRPPEPYKGSGVKYKEEIVRRKAGKKAAGTTA